MNEYRFAPIRALLEKEGVEEKILPIVARMLGHWKEVPPELKEAVRKLKCVKTANEPELVAFPCFTIMDEAYFPAGGIYRSGGIRAMGIDVPAYEEVDPDSYTGLLEDYVYGRLKNKCGVELAQLLEEGKKLPSTVPWSEVRDPMGIRVSNIRDAATVIAWALKGEFFKEFGRMPVLIEPDPGREATPEAVYTEISRYKSLFLGSIRFSIDKLMDEFGVEDDENDG